MITQQRPGDDAGRPQGTTLSQRFQLGRKLGGRRTGEVHEALDAQSGLPCAVKLVNRSVFPTPLLFQQTERELKQLEKVQSGEVAQIIAHGRQGDQLWFATELCPGQSLEKLVATGGRLPGPRAAALVAAIGRGLTEAARAGVVHRDLSPKNVLVGPNDKVKLINFGCPVPYSDKIQGVVEFVSPEEAEGKPVDQRANLYSLGAILYFCLTGQPPHGGSGEEVLRARLAGDPPRPSTVAPVAEAIEAIAMKALERASSKRYMTINQMVDALAGLGDAAAAPAPQGGAAAKAPAKTMIGMGAMNAADVLAAAGQMAAGTTARKATPPPGHPQVQQAAAAVQAARTAPPAQASVGSPGSGGVAPVAGGKSGKRKAPDAGGGAKPKFRETMWFKKGELDAAAAQAAASETAKSPDALALDTTDSLPIEDRYSDDGSLSNNDRERLSLRTGSTMMMDAAAPKRAAQKIAGGVSEKELVGEMRAGRGLIIAGVLGGIVLLIVVMALLLG